jgi:hypothetical protein
MKDTPSPSSPSRTTGTIAIRVSFFRSFVKHPHGHAWFILESPHDRLEGGHAGNFGENKPRYHEGVIQHIKDGDPNPIMYIWKTLDDGQFESGNPGYDPTFAWRTATHQGDATTASMTTS